MNRDCFWMAGAALAFAVFLHVGCGWAQPEATPPPTEATGWRAVTVAQGIQRPWSIAWLSDGRPIITGRPGTLHTLRDGRFEDVEMDEVPDLFVGGQGGLLDIALHPDDLQSEAPRIYMTVSTGTSRANRVSLVRGVLEGDRLRNIVTLFHAVPDKTGGAHFGSRLLWLPDGTLLMSIGDGGNPPRRIGDMLAREQAQNLGSHLGSIVRLTEDGEAPPDNPFLDKEGALPEIWTYGHRNIQGMTIEPESGRVWANEHGPRGGDELNLIEGGENYGWPEATLGRDYRTGLPIGRDEWDGMRPPVVVWSPAHAPSGLAFYTGDRLGDWQNSLFSGGLAAQDIRRIALDEQGEVVKQGRLVIGRRVRDVKQGPDGHLYAITDEMDGELLRIERD